MRIVKTLACPALVLSLCAGAMAADIALAHKEDNALADMDEIIETRSTLAKEFITPGMEITEETFRKVCGQVAKRVKELSQNEGFTFRHAALKNRNPSNAATPEEAELIGRFQKSRDLKEVRDTVVKDGKEFIRLTKPIYVVEACLACHGAKESRPKFIVEKYPDDKAYGFKTDDLRGIISALIPVDK